MILQNYETPYAEIHLNWLREHKPEYLRILHRENRLKQYLNRLIEPYMYQAVEWTKMGLNDDQIDEMINQAISPYIEPKETETEQGISYLEFQQILDGLYCEK